jgi:hypothetical protein
MGQELPNVPRLKQYLPVACANNCPVMAAAYAR